MAIAIGFWSQELTPGKEEAIMPVADLKISNVALGDTLVDSNGRSTVKITYAAPVFSDEDEDEDEDGDDNEDDRKEVTTILCSLSAGKFEHTTTDIVLEKGELYVFTVVGKNTVFLSGNYLDQAGVDNPPLDWMNSEDEEDLDELGSDVDMGSEELTDARLEEVVEEPSKKLKRTRELDIVADKEKSKVEKKNKKLKGENGQAVAVASGTTQGAEAAKKEEKDDEDEKKVEQKEKKEKKGKKDKSGEVKSVEKELPGGLKFREATVGSGPAAKKGNTVSMRYIGKLQNGKVFDQNTKGKPFTFRLGQGEVIKGWDEGIVGMHVGGERKLTIPAHLAYGKKGTDGIPPNSTLIFEVKLLEIK
ncbi:hypothetical protein AX14_007764 [Amanita brunnescens Koide BX004]|nr:hypothetical protein AX14_007764 [Amanita brunnescens Koide BX004]